MKNLIFDWSGVVRDAATSQLWIVNRIFQRYGVNTISLEEFRENWEQPYALFYKKYLPTGYDEEERTKLYRDAVLDPNGPKPSAYSGMPELIRKCKKRGGFLAIVSTDLSETLHEEVKEYGLEGTFSAIITDIDDKLEAVQEIIRHNSLNYMQTLFIGDSNHEIEVAKKVGIESVAVTWGFTSEQKLRAKSPDHIATTVQELGNFVLNR